MQENTTMGAESKKGWNITRYGDDRYAEKDGVTYGEMSFREVTRIMGGGISYTGGEEE